jgi:hypothetical protein
MFAELTTDMNKGTFLTEDDLDWDSLSSADLLAAALSGDQSSHKAAMVELRGFEPLTPSMPWKCATSCATAPIGSHPTARPATPPTIGRQRTGHPSGHSR